MPGCEGELETASRAGGEPASGFLRYVCGMIVENQLDSGAGRMSGIKKLEEFNKLSATVTVSDQGMNLSGEQVDPGQQAQRTVPLVLVITREGRVNAGFGRQIGRGRCDGLDAGFLIIRDDGYRLMRVPAFDGLFQNLDLAINTQNFGHLLLELGIATLQIITDLVRLDFLLAEDLAHRFPAPDWPNIRGQRPARSRVHGAPATASSTTRADNRDPWPCRKPETPAKP